MAQTQPGAGSSPQAAPQPPKPQPAPGAPAAGAGSGKGAGAQASPPPQQPAPGAGKKLQPLNMQQRQGLTQASQQGNLDVFLAKHPGMQKRFTNVAGGAGSQKQQTNVQNWQAGNKAAKAAGQPAPAPSSGAPATGAGNAKGTQPPAATPAPSGTPAAQPPSFLDAFNTAVGGGASDLLGPPAWTGADPITTARNAAQQQMDTANAGIRERYAGGGFGDSARAGIDQATSNANYGAQLADVLAARGTQQQQSGLDRLANMYTTAGSQDLQGRALGLQSDQALGNLGTGITAIGAQEQEIPNLSNAIALLTNMSGQSNASRGAMHPPKG